VADILTVQDKRAMKKFVPILLLVFFIFHAEDTVEAFTVTFVKSWGIKGSAPGRFNEPYGITVDREGFVYVTDARNSRVQKFTSDGEFLLEWGGFKKPAGIAVDREGFVYVSDYDADNVKKFDASGRLDARWGKNGKEEGDFDSPSDIAVDEKGNVYVVDLYNHRVQKFDHRGRFIKAWGKQGKVEKLRSILSPLFPKEKPGEFHYPAKLAAGDGRIYVADSYNNRVQVFSEDGEYLMQWGGMGFWRGRFRVASGIAVGPNKSVYVADFYNHRVQVFDRNGRYITSFGKMGIGSGEFRGPTDVAVSKDGYIYVSDWKNHRVQKFRITD
jgi:DNA-binding beta-propeller fold protein YncE